MTSAGTDLADTLRLHLRAVGLPLPMREHRPFLDRRFRCDLAWPDRKLAVEVDGGELVQGRHNRAAGMASDCEKQNLLVLAGWKTLRFVGSQVKDGSALRVVTEALRCLVRAEPPVEGWRPIASAPKDVEIDLWCQNAGHTWRLPAAYWFAEALEWRTLGGHRVSEFTPTHWMPLPPSPPEGSQL